MVLEQAAIRWNMVLRESGAARRGCGTVAHLGVILAQPLAWMNQTGPVVRSLLAELELSTGDLLVIHDDLDLPVGRLRFKRSGGSGGHNGIRSIQASLASQSFPRLKVGVGRPALDEETADYVLSPFHDEERITLRQALDNAVKALESYLCEGLDQAMNRFNAQEQEEAK